MACLEEGVIRVHFLLGNEKPRYDLQGSPVWRGSYPSVVVFIGTKHSSESIGKVAKHDQHEQDQDGVQAL